jgi:hypothetical protein
VFLLFSPVSVNRGRACLPRSANSRTASKRPTCSAGSASRSAGNDSEGTRQVTQFAGADCRRNLDLPQPGPRRRSCIASAIVGGTLCRVTERGELDQPYAAGVLPDPPGRGVQRQPGLTAAARAGQRDQACVIDQAVYLSPSAPLRGTKLVSSTGRLCRCASSERSGGTRLADPWYSCHTRSAGPRSYRVHDHSATVDST